MIKQDLDTLQYSADQYAFNTNGSFISGAGVGSWVLVAQDTFLAIVSSPGFALSWGATFGADDEFIVGYLRDRLSRSNTIAHRPGWIRERSAAV